MRTSDWHVVPLSVLVEQPPCAGSVLWLAAASCTIMPLAVDFVSLEQHDLYYRRGNGSTHASRQSPSAGYAAALLSAPRPCAGEIISDAECKRRMVEAKEKGEPHFYMMELGQGLIIDARDRGTVARLINSCCDPNAESQKWHDAGTGARSALFPVFLSSMLSGNPTSPQ